MNKIFKPNMLKKNVRTLLESERMTQAELADKIGMSQANVSKALNEFEKKCFTLDQVVSIAFVFGKTVDEILGINTPVPLSTTRKNIAELIVKLADNGNIRFIEYEHTEHIIPGKGETYIDNYGSLTEDEFDKTIKSYAVFFPDYCDIEYLGHSADEKCDLHSTAIEKSSRSRMIPLNVFLRKFVQIYEINHENPLPDEAYKAVVESYLNQLGNWEDTNCPDLFTM